MLRQELEALILRLHAAARIPDQADECELPEECRCRGGWHIREDRGPGTVYERCPRAEAARREAKAADVPGEQTFQSFERLREPEGFAAAKQWVLACLEGAEPAKLAYIRGEQQPTNTGCGKTHLLRAAARDIALGGATVAVVGSGAITAVVRGRALFDPNERGAADISARDWIASDVLILDDLGSEETAGPVTASFLMWLLDQRDQRRGSHALASNMNERELTSRYGPPLVSRLLGGAFLPAMRGKDFRRKATG